MLDVIDRRLDPQAAVPGCSTPTKSVAAEEAQKTDSLSTRNPDEAHLPSCRLEKREFISAPCLVRPPGLDEAAAEMEDFAAAASSITAASALASALARAGRQSAELPKLGLTERRKLSLKLPTAVKQPSNSDETYLPDSFKHAYDGLGQMLGSGTVASVRAARRTSDGQEVAVKVIFTEDEEMRLFTRNEYELMASLRHPNIIKVYEFHENRTGVMMCMENCTLGSLQGYISKRGVLPEFTALVLFQQLLRGVNHLHSKRIVHRDLKPDNLLMQTSAAQGEHVLKITDFNSAKRIGGGIGTTVMLSERGTCFYSAPELRFGRIWNERVDIWASGMCFYFKRHATSPFNILDPGHAEMLRSGRLPHIPGIGFSDLARALLLQCLTVEMRDRPAAMELLLHPVFSKYQRCQRSRSCEAAHSKESSESRSGFAEDSPDRDIDSGILKNLGRRTIIPAQNARHLHDHCISRYDDALGYYNNASLASWKELRNHSDALQRLANMRCERLLNEQMTYNDNIEKDEVDCDSGAFGSRQVTGESRTSIKSLASSGSEDPEMTPTSSIGSSNPVFPLGQGSKTRRSGRDRLRGAGGKIAHDRFFTTHGATNNL